MKFIGKTGHMLTAVLMLIIIITTTNINVFAAEKTWQEAYLEAMDSYQQNKTFCECRLIYLDDDDIPEFYIGDPMNMWYGGLYSFSDGELIKLRDFGFRDFFSAYSENSGIFRNDYYIERAGSKTGIKFIKMENYSLTVLDELSHDVINDIYEVNGETVDKETYNNKIAEYSLVDVTSDYLTYDEMKKYLFDSMENESAKETETQVTTENENTKETETQVTMENENIQRTETQVTTERATNDTTSASNIKHTSSPKTGDSEPVFCELIVVGFILGSIIMLLRKKYKNNI